MSLVMAQAIMDYMKTSLKCKCVYNYIDVCKYVV